MSSSEIPNYDAPIEDKVRRVCALIQNAGFTPDIASVTRSFMEDEATRATQGPDIGQMALATEMDSSEPDQRGIV